MRHLTSSAVLLALMTAAGCATDAADSSPGGSGGGKADGTGEQGLHVEARVTTLGPSNEIRWPVAVDDASDVDEAINRAIAFEVVTGDDLAATQAAWTDAPDDPHIGVDMADFVVNANIRNVLSLTINYEYMGAYPDEVTEYLNFNSNTGATVEISDIVDASALPTLAAQFDEQLQARIAQLKLDLASDIEAGDIDASTWDNLHVTAADLESFSTTADGITFHYDARFPHASVALEPDGDFSLTIDELDAYIGNGLWAGEY